MTRSPSLEKYQAGYAYQATQFRLNKPGNMSGFGGKADIQFFTMMRDEFLLLAHSQPSWNRRIVATTVQNQENRR